MLQISPLVVPAAACAFIGGLTLSCVIFADLGPQERPSISVFTSAPAPEAIGGKPVAVSAGPARHAPSAAAPGTPGEEKIFPGRKLKKKPVEKAPSVKGQPGWVPDDDDDDDD